MTRHCGAMAAREELETVVEPGRKALYAKGRGACRGKLDCQRDAVEPTTNPGDRGRNACVEREMRRGRACALHKQPNRAVARQVPAIRATFCGHRKRRYGVNPLALCPEWLAAGGDPRPPPRRGAQPR